MKIEPQVGILLKHETRLLVNKSLYENTLLGKDLQKQMEYLLNDHPEASFFCDETPIGGSSGISTEFLVNTAKKFKAGAFFWLACNHNWPSTSTLKSGEYTLFV